MRPGEVQRRDASSRVWAVTSYFNPVGYRSRRENYRVFRRHLELPLLTVEWSPTGRFELGPGDAEVLVQLDGGDVMWQKERLLNIGVGRLPEHCTHVAWLDCDIVFERRGLADAIVEALGRDRLVQLYDRVAYLGPAARRDADRGDGGSGPLGAVRFEAPGVAAAFRAGGATAPAWPPPVTDSLADVAGKPSPGFAWAARRELLERQPLFDALILGSCDSAYFRAAAGLLDQFFARHPLSAAHRAYVERRAKPLRGEVGGAVGFVHGRIATLWHGRVEDRSYRSRARILVRHGFDPDAFLRLAPSGVWAWANVPDTLPGEVRAYFAHRNEDGAPEAAESRDG